MWSGQLGSYIPPKGRHGSPGKAKNLRKRENRRRVLPGYPVEPHPFSLDEVRRYLSGDRIVCLRCGRSFRALGHHLTSIHQITDDEYRALYGLPWVRGLTCEASHQLHREVAQARIADGTLSPPAGVYLEKARQTPRRKSQPFRHELSLKNLKSREPDA